MRLKGCGELGIAEVVNVVGKTWRAHCKNRISVCVMCLRTRIGGALCRDGSVLTKGACLDAVFPEARQEQVANRRDVYGRPSFWYTSAAERFWSIKGSVNFSDGYM